jgi:hypothetical protein
MGNILVIDRQSQLMLFMDTKWCPLKRSLEEVRSFTVLLCYQLIQQIKGRAR